MKHKSVEILAPAGSFESMKAAVIAGADAVYIGGSRFGARAYADNPQEDRLLEAIDYAHLHGRKLYMTVNTLMKEDEMEELYEYLLPYYVRGIDAVIVQDIGVFSFIRNCFPDLPIHASTQMTITGVHGAALLKKMGAERIVTARELSLEEIKGIHEDVDIEIESFVHGALCYCYSGQCLFSSLIGGRSGNRGRCAQTCRLPYDIKSNGHTLNKKDEHYVLSLKDLCTLDLLPDVIDAGVYSLKIEGRMKSPRYTAGVVSIYRKYVDLYLEQGRIGYRVDENDRKQLLDLFDRGGQTDGYYKQHNGKNMIVWKEKPSFREGNQELYEELDRNFVEKQIQKSITGKVNLVRGKQAELEVTCEDHVISVQGGIVQGALNQPMDEGKVRKQLEKTGNTPFTFTNLDIALGETVFLPVQELNELRREALFKLQEDIFKPYIRDIKRCSHDFPSKAHKAGHSDSNRMKLTVSLEKPDGISEVLIHPDVDLIYIDAAEFKPETWKDTIKACHAAGKRCGLTMPHVFRTEAERFFNRYQTEVIDAGFDGILIRSIEEVGYCDTHKIELPMMFDYNMYAMNDLAGSAMRGIGAAGLTWPVELNSRELEQLSYQGELIVYGRLPMMVTAQCLCKDMTGCEKTPVLLFLKDRLGKEFPVKNHCVFCYNTIYNTAPLSLLGMEKLVKRLNPSSLRLQFTIETPKEIKEILYCFSENLLNEKAVEPPFTEFTRGHFKRGVE